MSYHLDDVKTAVSRMSYTEGFDFAERHRLLESSLRHPGNVAIGTFRKLVRALEQEGRLPQRVEHYREVAPVYPDAADSEQTKSVLAAYDIAEAAYAAARAKALELGCHEEAINNVAEHAFQGVMRSPYVPSELQKLWADPSRRLDANAQRRGVGRAVGWQ